MKAILFLLPLMFSFSGAIKRDESFSVNKSLCSQNWEFFGTSLCLKSKLMLLPEMPNKQGLAWAKQTLKYKDAFTMELSFKINHARPDTSSGESFAIWLLRESPKYTRMNYTNATSNFYGFTGLYKGVGIFLMPNKTDNKTSNLYGMENKKLFRHEKGCVEEHARACSFDMSQERGKIRIYFSQDYLYVYKKVENKFIQCFSFQETFEKEKEFYVGLSGSSLENQTMAIDILEVKVLSDILNEQPIPEERKEHHEKEVMQHLHSHSESSHNEVNTSAHLDNLYKLQNELKNTVMKIKQFNHKSFKDLKEGIKKQPKIQDLLVFSIDEKITSLRLEGIEENLLRYQERKKNSTHSNVDETNQLTLLQEELNQLASYSRQIEAKLNDLTAKLQRSRGTDNSLRKKLTNLNELQSTMRPKIKNALLETELVMEELLKLRWEPDSTGDNLEYFIIFLLVVVILLALRNLLRAGNNSKHHSN